MKRILIYMALLLCISCVAFAERPGDTVTISFMICENPNQAISARVGMEFDSRAFEFVSTEVISKDVLNAAPISPEGKFGLVNLSGIGVGEIGTITLRIKADAPAGRYEIKPVVDSVYNVQREAVELTVKGGTVSVDHVWDDGRVTVEATCYTEGIMTYYCFYCDEKRAETIPVTAHREGAAVVTKVATCTEDGVQIYSCDICHDTLREESIPPLGHAEGDVVVTQAPTCGAAGTRTIQCANCGKTVRTESIPVTGKHTEVIDKAVAATCTAAGKTEGKYCSACNEVIVAQEVIPALGHVEGDPVVVVEPTATTPGSAMICCTTCGELIRMEEIPALGAARTPGDADGSGRVDIMDALLTLQYSVGWDVVINTSNADVDDSGAVNIMDALMILQYSVGWDVELQ